MTVGSGGCTLSNRIGKITTSLEVMTPLTQAPIPVTISAHSVGNIQYRTEYAMTKTDFKIDGIKKSSYSADISSPDSSNSDEYNITNGFSITLETGLNPQDRYSCQLWFSNSSDGSLRLKGNMDAIVDSNGNLILTFPANTKIYAMAGYNFTTMYLCKYVPRHPY